MAAPWAPWGPEVASCYHAATKELLGKPAQVPSGALAALGAPR